MKEKEKEKKLLKDIDNLYDAKYAGTINSNKCSLIITENDSIQSKIIKYIDNNKFGCYSLKDKLINVKKCNNYRIMKNKEIQNITKILGISLNQNYTDIINLRYGSVIIITNSDIIGIHIKGLIINLFHTLFPNLMKIKGFIRQFIFPIIKVIKENEVKLFYNKFEFNKWKLMNKNILKNWKLIYYKDINSFNDEELKELFSDFENNLIDFLYENESDDDFINLAFDPKKFEERKQWLQNYEPNNTHIEYNTHCISYKNFINKELILYPIYDNIRSIPSLCDGLRPSQRKILYSLLKLNLNEEKNISELIKYIKEISLYSYGEESLIQTIIFMSQNFINFNNINLIESKGEGIKDINKYKLFSAKLNSITKYIFNKYDSNLINYKLEYGKQIEPDWYIPIIPLILVNGAEGIGTGFRTFIPCFNPYDLINTLKNKIRNNKFMDIEPWHKGYKNKIIKDKNRKGVYILKANYYWSKEENNKVIIINESPINKLSYEFNYFLKELLNDNNNIIEKYEEKNINNKNCFEIYIKKENAEKYKNDNELFNETFRLNKYININNMILFSPEGKIKKYDSIEEILDEFYYIRIKYYELRKNYLLNIFKNEINIINNKIRFIEMVINNKLNLINENKDFLINELNKLKFDSYNILDMDNININEEKSTNNFDYLLNLKECNKKEIEKLNSEKLLKEKELKILENTDIKKIWIDDLDELEKQLKHFKEFEDKNINGI